VGEAHLSAGVGCELRGVVDGADVETCVSAAAAGEGQGD
jgi:hypothetical protein